MSVIGALALLLVQPDPSAARVAAAMAEGRVGERYDGYLDFVVPPDEATRRAVAAVNVKRRALYTDLGARRNLAPEKVGIYAACNLMGRVRVGGYYRLAEAQWTRRDESAPVPRPDYCPDTSNEPR